MKLAATLYTGYLAPGKEYYMSVYRRRIYDDGTEFIDSIEAVYRNSEAGIATFNYKSDDIIENMQRDTHVIEAQVWRDQCEFLARYLTENKIS